MRDDYQMSVEVDGEWGFSLQGKDLQLRTFHTVLAETLTLYPPSDEPPPLPEAFRRAWAKGLDAYRKVYEKALGFSERATFGNRRGWLDFLHGSYKNNHNKYSLLLFQIGQNGEDKPRKENSRHVRKELIEKNGPQCQVCHKPFEEKRGRPLFDAHHIVPEACGGKTELENMAALCKECHSSIKSPLQEMHAEIWSIYQQKKNLAAI